MMSRRASSRALWLVLACSLENTRARPAATACPPSCANNELLQLLDQFCSDKGTFWQSKHHYGTAYHSIFGSIRESVTSILEVGIGEDTAPSVATWAAYFPRAHVYPVDIKTKREVAERAKANGVEVVVFDRGGYIFHGRVKALADAAREAGLKF